MIDLNFLYIYALAFVFHTQTFSQMFEAAWLSLIYEEDTGEMHEFPTANIARLVAFLRSDS